VDIGRTAMIRAPGALLSATRTFNPGTGWHVYRFEAKSDPVWGIRERAVTSRS
jgi:hypothetical protein